MNLDLNYLTLGLYVFLIYWVIVLILNRKGILQRYNISAFGPLLMIRTKRGGKFLDELAKGVRRKRFWRTFANLGFVLVLISMILMFALIVNSNYVMLTEQPEPTSLNKPWNWLVIPGLNEFIPMCAWIGFVVAIVVHELSHAILSRVEGIRVKSMGLLVALVPIGAFTEPDEDQLFGESKSKGSGNGGGNGNKNENEGKKIATARERTRILSAGIMSNYFVALIAFLLFFSLLFSIQPVADTTLFVQNVTTGSPAERAGINPGMFITKVDGTRITSGEDMNEAMEGKERVSLTVLNKSGKEIEIVVEDCYKTEGIMILEVIEGSPAYNAGLKEGMSIIRMDDKEIKGYRDFQNFMNETAAGEVIEVQTKGRTFLVKLEKSPSPHSKNGFLGIYFSPANNVSGMVIGEFSAKEYHEYLCSIPSSLTSINGWLRLTILPIIPIDFGGFSSFNPLLSHFYEPVGIASFLGKNVFSLADVLFWTAWINFLVGLFNALPASPLDGGYIFREVLNPVLGVRIKDEKKKEKFSKAITAAVTIFIFSSIFFTAVGPYIMHV